MRTFKNTRFDRFAAKEGINDAELKGMVDQLEAGQADADLGGGVFKVWVARPGEGKSGGYRVIVFFRSGDKTFFQYGFAKSVLANISEKELRVLKRSAKRLFSFDDDDIKDELKNGRLIEI
ncbi:type II toxin-antitoxin system RelE/ParE family toxin [Treponema primitia]|uniref:type II toxin-antitoxin system RelE/ParE family toxin n=1 Tax=Treponema primitia TaxID=88058 RepID=UPI000255520C|nr:type II toxin-antitoxin system RelE/ParE family toxin [Treponema primitia]